MNKILHARYLGHFQIDLEFSDHAEGIFDAAELLTRQGPLLDALRGEAYFQRFFIDAGALCWPNGLELSPRKLRASIKETALA